MNNVEMERQAQLERCVPDIWNHESYLYIGANEKRFHFSMKLSELSMYAGANIDVVEVDNLNIPSLMNVSFINQLFNVDIKALSESFVRIPLSHWNVVMWSHGPTCLNSKEDAELTLNNLKTVCDLMVIMCPWGVYPEDQDKISSYSTNKFALYPYFFEQLGFVVDTLGSPDVAGSNLLAIWRNDA